MIDPKELRLGNYLFSHNNLVRVTGIKENAFTVTPVGDYKADIKETNIVGIPLTPEILEILGFHINTTVKEEVVCFSGAENKPMYSNFTYIDWSKDFFILNVIHGNFYYRNVKINFIHQLQNLYFTLTGEELPISSIA